MKDRQGFDRSQEDHFRWNRGGEAQKLETYLGEMEPLACSGRGVDGEEGERKWVQTCRGK